MRPDRRRRVGEHVRRVLRVSERWACRVVGQPRSTHRHRATTPGDEPRLVGRIIELATKYGRYGYRDLVGVSERPNAAMFERLKSGHFG